MIDIVVSGLQHRLAFRGAANRRQYTERCKRAGLKIHPARLRPLLDFFLRLLTEEGDIVVDPFCGWNTTGPVAERLNRRWLAIESVEAYLEGSRFRFS